VLVAQRIIELHPTHRAALASLARAKIDLGSPTDAEASICDALLGAPGSVSLRQLLAELYEASGKRDAADRVRREICDAQRWRGGDPPTSLILPGEVADSKTKSRPR